MNRGRRFPVAADVNGGRRFQEPHGLREPRIEPLGILINRSFLKAAIVERLRQVVGRICKHQIDETIRKMRQSRKNVLTEETIANFVWRDA